MACYQGANTRPLGPRTRARGLCYSESRCGFTTAGLRASTSRWRRRERPSGGATFIVVMQIAKVWD